MRTCRKCSITSDVVRFVKNQNMCVLCKNEYMAIYYTKNRDRILTRNKKWREENPEKDRKIWQKRNQKRKYKLMRYWDG